MEAQDFVFATAGVILIYFLAHTVGRKFDPFAPVWLFLVGYVQVYIVQAISYRDWALRVRGQELVAAANYRALWALLWFLAVYHLGINRRLASSLPRPPRGWSTGLVSGVSPFLILWGLFCAGVVIRGGSLEPDSLSPEEALFRSFPFVMMVAAILLIVTGRSPTSPRPFFLLAGLLVAASYIAIWMFNGKRSHSLIGVLATVCACYITKLKRPSWPVLVGHFVRGWLVVAIAIGWRGNDHYEFSMSGFAQYLSDFKLERILESLNIKDFESELEPTTYETTEYGGFLLMMDTVPEKADYDYGANYIRIVSTFIPRILWPTKPLFGREPVGGRLDGRLGDGTGRRFHQPRHRDPRGHSAQRRRCGNGNRAGLASRSSSTSYEYFRLHADVPWVQFWWAITFYNAWFMVVNDDPMVWFYYNWGFSTCPIVVCLWWASSWVRPRASISLKVRGDWAFSLKPWRGDVFMILAICFTNFGPYHRARSARPGPQVASQR